MSLQDVNSTKAHQLNPDDLNAPKFAGFNRFESALGFYGAIGASSGMLIAMMVIPVQPFGRKWGLTDASLHMGAFIASAAVEYYFLRGLFREYRRSEPPFVLNYVIAIRGPKWPLFALPLTCWWAAHAWIALFVGVWIKGLLGWGLENMGVANQVIGFPALAICTFATSHASLLHLMLALRVAGMPATGLKVFWRLRWLMDLLIVGIAFLMFDPTEPLQNSLVGRELNEVLVKLVQSR